jgi:alpha-galactosidase
MSKLSTEQLEILRNGELLAFNQDEIVGTPAKPFTPSPPVPPTTTPEYFAGASSRGVHVFIINTSSATAMKQFTFASVPGLGKSGSFKVHDMWNSTNLPGTHTAASTFTVSVAAHDTVAYLITKA